MGFIFGSHFLVDKLINLCGELLYLRARVREQVQVRLEDLLENTRVIYLLLTRAAFFKHLLQVRRYLRTLCDGAQKQIIEKLVEFQLNQIPKLT